MIPEQLTWRVAYRDGSQLDEFDEERPDGRGPAEALTKPVESITLFSAEGKPVHHVVIPEGAEAVFRWRKMLMLNLNDGTQETLRAHCMGWKRGEQGVYLFVFDDGSTLLSDNFQAI